MRHILIIDNHLTNPCNACYAFRENVAAKYNVLVRNHDELPETLAGYSHVVLTGGAGKLEATNPGFRHLRQLIKEAIKEEIPLLGICFGHQAIVAALASDHNITHYRRPTTGWVKIRRIRPSRLLKNLPGQFFAFEHHHDDVSRLPAGYMRTATSRRNPIEAFEHETLPVFGVQFHPEINRRRASHILHEQVVERVPSNWLVLRHKGRTPFAESISQTIFANFYDLEKAKTNSKQSQNKKAVAKQI